LISFYGFYVSKGKSNQKKWKSKQKMKKNHMFFKKKCNRVCNFASNMMYDGM